jgi:hypothetical protein
MSKEKPAVGRRFEDVYVVHITIFLLNQEQEQSLSR